MGYFDPTGTEVFSNSNTALVTAFNTFPIGPALIPYNTTFQVPDTVNCASSKTGGLCIFRMVTNTGWNSCTFVNVTTCKNCPPPPPPPPQCVEVDNEELNFCYPQIETVSVYIAAGASPTAVQASTETVFWANLNNTGVFYNGNNSACREAYRVFLCGLNLPPCPGSGPTVGAACKQNCQTALQECQLNPGESLLYNCNALPDCPGTSASSTVLASFVTIFATVVVALLV